MERNLNCKTLPVQRAAGQSAVVGAAYRAGERLFDERQERVADFTRRSPDVRESFILAPEGAPDWVQDRGELWNAAEAAERRKDGRPARDVQLGLAWELSPEEQRAAVIEFARAEFVDKGHVADIAFHRYGQRVVDASDEGRATIRRWAQQDVPFLEAAESQQLNSPHVKIERSSDGMVRGYKLYQPHAHVYVTPRPLDGDGFAAMRNREFDRSETAMKWRYEWPRIQNEYLARAGIDLEVTATRRKDAGDAPARDDTVQGVARCMELRGEPTRAREVADFNGVHNELVRLAVAENGGGGAGRDATETPQQAPDSSRSDGLALVHANARQQATADHAARDPKPQRMQRIAAWWHNMGQSFSGWRSEMNERVRDTWQRMRNAPEPKEPKEPRQSDERH